MARKRRRDWQLASLDGLESRLLMTGPTIDPIADVSVPSGKSLIVPITASDADGYTLNYSVQSDNGNVTGRIYRGTIDLKLTVAGFGDLTLQLLPQVAPKTVDTIVSLVNSGFYNNLTFHRIISSFVVQAGDPNGDGTGGPGFKFDDEFNPKAIFSGYGQLAMANSGKDTNGSQFFITTSTPRYLDFNHTIFGQLVRGNNVLNAIKSVPTDANNKPLTPVVITSASIYSNPTDAVLILDSTNTSPSTITVTADDGHGNHDTKTLVATSVSDTANNDPPILGPVGNAVTATNTPLNITLSGTDLEGDALIYAAAVTDQTANAKTSVSGNVVTVTPNAGFVGDVHVIVGVRQGSGNTRFDTQVITVTVKNQVITANAINPNVVEGSSITSALATFTTVVPYTAANYSAMIVWGDSTTSPGVVTLAASGNYEVRASKSYSKFGTYPFLVTIHDATAGTNATASGTATVTDAPLSTQIVPAAPQDGTRTISGLLARITDSNPQGVVGDLSALVSWGDGTTSPATLSANAIGSFDVSGTKTYNTLGTYPVTIAVTSLGGSTSSAQTTVVIPNLAPTLDAIGPLQVAEGSILSFQAIGHDPDSGQTLTYTLGAASPIGTTIDPTTGVVSWTPQGGPLTSSITVIVTDSGSPQLFASRTVSVSVLNNPPSVTLEGGAAGLTQFDTFTRTGHFTDAGSGPWAASVDYGDGTGRVALALNPDRSFTLSHRYTSAGVFTPLVIVTDKWGASGAANVGVSVAPRPIVHIVHVTANKKRGVITSFTVVFDGQINTPPGISAGLFKVATAGRDRRFGTRDDVVSTFQSASYNGTTVTLLPTSKRLGLSGAAQLRVTGLTDLFGRVIANSPGGVFIASVS